MENRSLQISKRIASESVYVRTGKLDLNTLGVDVVCYTAVFSVVTHCVTTLKTVV